MNKLYCNGKALYTMSPREAAKFELILGGNLTYNEAEEIVQNIYNQALDNIDKGE